MKRSRFTEEQIIGILKEHEAGISVSDLCRKHGVSDASIYKWKAKFGGWMFLKPNACVLWKMRMASSNACLPMPCSTMSH